MVLYAFKNGVTVLDEATLNALICTHPCVFIFDGTQVDAREGPGTVSNDLSLNTYMVRFKLPPGQDSIGRVELELFKVRAGADLVLEIRDDTFNPDGSNDGALLKSIAFPAKIFSTSPAYISLPIDLAGLTPGSYYWLRVNKAGDTMNHLVWRGEAYQDADYPVFYRSKATGAWTAGNALHFKVYANTPGTYQLRHGIWGINGKTLIEYNDNGTISHIWRWLPAADGSWQIVDKVMFIYDANGVLVRVEVE